MIDSHRACIVIAEAATNHNGDINIAKKMIDAAKSSGADYVKFQSWRLATMSPENPSYHMMGHKELSDDEHFDLLEYCKNAGIGFLTTCFDKDRVDFLSSLGMDMIKVASTDVTSIAMLKLLRDKFDHIVLSTGMATADEVREADDILKAGNYTLLHCVSIYPTLMSDANLRRMIWLQKFTRQIGYSDHTIGTAAARMAIAMGATCIEKHFTLKHEKGNIFSEMSALPQNIKEICDWSREYQSYLGDGNIDMNEAERASREQFVGRWGDNR